MKLKQSQTLVTILAKGAILAERNRNINPVDAAAMAMLDEPNCHGLYIMRRLLRDWQLYQIKVRLQHETDLSTGLSTADRAALYDDFLTALERICSETSEGRGTTVNSGHLLLYILRGTFTSSRVLGLYDLSVETVIDYVKNLPAEEDYYSDLNALKAIRTYSLGAGNMPVLRFDRLDDDGEDEQETASSENLDKYGVDMTAQAREGKIDPVVGREREIERLVQILARRKKNNPILIGEAGVGKSAIVEGLALRIASGDVPASLYDKKLFSLDVAAIVAGTKYRGEFEERIGAILTEVQQCGIILFIDEIHTIVGAGSSQGSLDAANILKPALTRGTLQCIGATTLDEFRNSIESDAALERRFQKILVEPTTREQTLVILRNIASHYERHHNVRYSDDALRECVDLTDRYLTDRSFPDKAIDIMDEVGSRARVRRDKEPDEVRKIEEALQQCSRQKREAVMSLVFDDAAAARIRESALRSRLNECRAEWRDRQAKHPVEITVDDVREVISTMTGIPMTTLSQSERTKLSLLSRHLSHLVVGQEAAIEKISNSVLRSRSGLKDPSKPIGVFMFVGPTGVGKTLLAKELARQLFDRDDVLVRIDMSEYSERHNISRMIGSPPGYVGYGEGGQLTETIRRQPYSVVLFDEIEKAHPDVCNIMLQIFDEGALTDGLGRKVDFRNTVIIMTSNVGSKNASQRRTAVGYGNPSSLAAEMKGAESAYRSALEDTFPPEFINRIDDVIIFRTLAEADVEKIVDLELRSLIARASLLGYRLSVSAGAKRRLAQLGYEPRYGVRSLKRVILQKVEEPMAGLIVANAVSAGGTIKFSLHGADIVCTTEKAAS